MKDDRISMGERAVLRAPKVHVVCAPPNGSNPGMASVDLAFETVARSAGITDVTYWRLWDVSEWRDFRSGSTLTASASFEDPDTGLVYQSMRERIDEALEADLIVYWGDFLHMATYQRQMADVLHRRIGGYTPERARELVARSMMLTDVEPSTRDRVLTYGSTLSMNTAADYASPYGEELTTLLRGVRRAWMRDPYSAQVARTITGRLEDSNQGADAAFLLHDGQRRAGSAGRGLGVFIGRSQVTPEVVARFGRLLSSRLGLVANWIPWGVPPAFWPVDSRRRFRAAWPALEHPSDSPTPRQLLQTRLDALRGVPKSRVQPAGARALISGLAEFDLIVTDTYHLAINAWAQGVPAVCLVDHSAGGWDVNSGDPNNRRDKRIDLYSQLDALGLIVEMSHLGRRVPQEVARVSDHLADRRLMAVTQSRIAAMHEQSLSAVVTALSHVDQTHPL